MPRVRKKLGEPQQDFAYDHLPGLLGRHEKAHEVQEPVVSLFEKRSV